MTLVSKDDNTLACLCGEEKFKALEHIPQTSTTFYMKELPGTIQSPMYMGECVSCGLVRQIDLPFENEQEYDEFYKTEYPPTSISYQAKDYAHDRELAKQRCAAYGIRQATEERKGYRILDVGSGSGAFVEECRDKGHAAFGCEISKYAYSKDSENCYIYRDRLENVRFPTDHFDIVTCHDIIEHVLDPIKFLEEMFRITKQHGACIVDLPRFYVAEGMHHWKIEHLWFWTTEQFMQFVEKAGFMIPIVNHPIPSKTVFCMEKPEQIRPKILLPPGIGDSYWSMTKLEAFLKQKGLGLPDLYVVSNKDGYNGQDRAFPFLEMFPWAHATWETFSNSGDPNLKKVWKEAYAKEGRTVFEGVHGTDYFISYNGHLRVGAEMEEIDPHLETNWYPEMFISLEQRRFEKQCKKDFGKYFICYFVFQGTYAYWTKEFPLESVIESVQKVAQETGLTPVFVGSVQDKEKGVALAAIIQKVKEKIPSTINLAGQTSVEQLFGVLKGSELVLGYPSGLTIMSAVLKCKTFIIWNDYYDEDFAWNCAPPDVRGKTYFCENTKGLLPTDIVARAKSILAGEAQAVVRTERPVRKKRHGVSRKDRSIKTGAVVQKANGLPKDVTVTCVLKSGGDYGVDYVQRLKNMVDRNTTIPHKFICLTDMEIDQSICESIQLKDGFQKWWAKVELFRQDLFQTDYVLYFDLDTVILDSIDDMFRIGYDFHALRPWNTRNQRNGLFASGMMAWKNKEYEFLYKAFDDEKMAACNRGDQEYLSKVLAAAGKHFIPLQDVIPGIYSYKRNCKKRLPEGTRIVCFHGRPRPAEVNDEWVKDNWK